MAFKVLWVGQLVATAIRAVYYVYILILPRFLYYQNFISLLRSFCGKQYYYFIFTFLHVVLYNLKSIYSSLLGISLHKLSKRTASDVKQESIQFFIILYEVCCNILIILGSTRPIQRSAYGTLYRDTVAVLSSS